MSIQHFQAQFPAGSEAQFFDPKTGTLTRIGQYFMLQMLNRTGAGTGIVPKVSDPLTATGTTLATALELATDWNTFSTVAAGTGCVISTALDLQPGNDIQVFNGGANNLNVYPPTATDQIDALGAGSPFVLAAGKLRIFECWATNPSQFRSFGN